MLSTETMTWALGDNVSGVVSMETVLAIGNTLRSESREMISVPVSNKIIISIWEQE